MCPTPSSFFRSLLLAATAFAASSLWLVVHANPPNLTANSGLTVTQNQEVTITTAMLNATDLDANGFPADATDIEFVLDARDPVTFAGSLRIYDVAGGRAVQPGEAVTLQEIQDGLLRYRASIADQLFDNFLFHLRDLDGNYAEIADRPPGTAFNFPITIVQLNTRPIAGSGSGSLGLGGTFEGTLVATDNDRPAQALTYSIVTPPASGSVQLLNATAGTFRYTAALGFAGPVSFTYQVSDGALNSAAPGTFTLDVANQPPGVESASFSIAQNRPFSGTIAANDPDLPKQTLTFNVTQQPQKGAVTVAADGTFSYTPGPGRFGEDSFRVTVSDGEFTSNAGTIALEIAHQPVAGDLFIATKSRSENDPSSTPIVLVIDPDQFDFTLKSAEGLFTSLRMMTYSRWSQRLYVIEGDPGEAAAIIEIDPISGAQRVAFADEILQFPLGLAASDDGYLYISNAPLVLGEPVDQAMPGSQIIRVDLRNGAHTVVLEDGPLHFPTGLSFGPDGALYIVDAETFAFGDPDAEADATILRLDLATSEVTTVTQGNLLADPFGLLALSDGSFLVTELRGDIVKIAPGGAQSHVYDAVDFHRAVTALTMDENGIVYATAIPFGDGATGAILRVLDPLSATPTTEVFLEGVFLGEPWGIVATSEHHTIDAWQGGFFSAEDRANPALEATVWGDNADPDGDGLPNLLEFALNLSPVVNDSGGVLAPYLRSDGGTERLALTVSRRLGTDVTLELEASSDLVTWETIGGPASTSAAGTTATFEDTTALGGPTPRFIRLRVARP